jgi:superfamily II DNA or RNA helicase
LPYRISEENTELARIRWSSSDNSLARYVKSRRTKTLDVYRTEPERLEEDFNTEESVLAGGYQYRQAFEVIQNAADAILEGVELGDENGRILVRLTPSRLYVANTGAPLTKDGIIALLGAHSSRKRKNQIGRFGLGFKSLLALGGKIDLFSRSVSIRFDPSACRKTIRSELDLSPADPAPSLRLAEVISFKEEAQNDADLYELSRWATTVLRVEIDDVDMKHHLHDELQDFPREFVLFLPINVSLELDFGEDGARFIDCERQDDTVILHEGDENEQWLLVERMVPVTDEAARKDAGSLHIRDEVPLIWAVPFFSIEDVVGRFWAFFPTNTFSRVPGIVNAPWKIDFGRSALSPGVYNDTLMQAAAALIVDSIPKLALPDDPARTLDVFPRGLDSKDEPAAPLVDGIWSLLVDVAAVPDGTGALRLAEDLFLHPIDDFELVARWLELVKQEDILSQFVHPSCLKRQRLSRLKVLRSRLDGEFRQPGICGWLEAACSASVEDVKGCFSLVAELANLATWWWVHKKSVREAKIVLSDKGHLVRAQAAVIDNATIDIDGVYGVDPLLLADEAARMVLVNLLSVQNLDDDEWERRIRQSIDFASRPYGGSRDQAWKSVWRLLRVAPAPVIRRTADRHNDLKVQTIDGNWRLRQQVLISGQIISLEDSGTVDAASLIVNPEAHALNASIIEAIGVTEFPRNELHKFSRRNVSFEYDTELWSTYRTHLNSNQKPRYNLVGVIGEFSAPHGWQLVEKTSGSVRARITEYLLLTVEFGRCGFAHYGHTSRTEVYPRISVVNPFVWSLLKHGTVLSAGHHVPIGMIVLHYEKLLNFEYPPFSEFATGLKKLVNRIPEDFEVKGDWDEGPFWSALAAHCQQDETGEDDCRAIYEWLAEERWYPPMVKTKIGDVKFKDCYAAQSPALAEAALAADVPTVVLAPDAVAFWIECGAQDLEPIVHSEIAWKDENLVPLIDVSPEFAEVLNEMAMEKAFVRFVGGLALRVGSIPIDKPCVLEAGELWLDRAQLDHLSWQAQVELLIGEVVNAGWFAGDAASAVSQLLQHSVLRLRNSVAQGADLAERLLLAVRGVPSRLLDSFEETTRAAIPDNMSDDGRRLAEFALLLHGPAVLSRIRETLAESGLQPPLRWGTQEARDFVAALSFPTEFAVSSRAKRPPELTVSGPMPLGDLHDYQAEIVHELESVVKRRGIGARAVISLPTGAGKTRVAVEAAVRHVLTGDLDERYLLWVAQTDELCEQAVQSFRQVWSSGGREWTDLRIVRLWGGNPDPAPSPDGVPTIVVATIQTLTSRLGEDRLSLLKSCALVVIDESHHAITPSYTRLLNWFLPDEGETEEVENRPPVIGLTATPFRGHDEDETQRLANRFGRRMLPAPERQPELYDQLRSDGILSTIVAEALRHEILFEFTAEELDHFERFNEFPPSALQRLTGDQSRNELIVNCVREAVEQGPVLLFANSVAHAQYLAARLCVSGIPSASIDANTDMAVRQYFIRRFQEGEVKVLANYGVLTTGFDAPKTSTIVISRPVFSPVAYMQMVGRGLRGPKNGGTDECKIITVVDNLRQFGDNLAYHYFMNYYF